jgi:hypothetical protein
VDFPLFTVASFNPPLPQRLREFKRFECFVSFGVIGRCGHLKLVRQRGDAIAKLRVPRVERDFVDAAGEVQIQEPILLTAHVRELALNFRGAFA